MPKLTDTQRAKAASTFFAEVPSASLRVLSTGQAEADALGVRLDELQWNKTFKEIEKYAREQGRDYFDLLFLLAASGPEEYERLKIERQAEIDAALRL